MIRSLLDLDPIDVLMTDGFYSTGVLTVFVIGQSLYQVSISVPQYNGQWRLQSDSEASRYASFESVSSIIIFIYFISTLQQEARPNEGEVTYSDKNPFPKYFDNLMYRAMCYHLYQMGESWRNLS